MQVEPYIHPTVSDSIYRLLNIIQDGSHAEGGLRLKVDEYIQSNQSDYLFKSCIYLLFDIIIWYKNISGKYADFEHNNSLWAKIEQKVYEQMIIEQDILGNYHCGEIVLTYTEVKNKGYNIGDKISIVEVVQNTNEKTKQYKIKAIKTQRA
jgi:hypothetical protein